MKAKEIEQTVYNIRKDLLQRSYLSEDDLKKEYKTLFDENPMLFSMAIKPDFNNEIFNTLITYRKKIESGESTQEDMDVAFGKVMAKKYVDPIVEKLNRDGGGSSK